MMTSTLGSGSLKKLPPWKRTRDDEAVGFDVFLEDRRDLGQVEADAGEVRILERNLDDEVALRGSAVGGRLVLGPGKLGGDGHVGAAADRPSWRAGSP